MPILASCKQTRFHLDERGSPEIDVPGLTILVTDDTADAKRRKKSEGKELLLDAHLRLKRGVHYGLLGRNGSGKSTLLRAMGDKLIPAIPHATRIALLQQTETDLVEDSDKTVLQVVLGSDSHRNEITERTAFLSRSLETDDPLAPVRAIRSLRHQELEKQLFLAQKNAHLKSGVRGLQARKELRLLETKVEAALEMLNQEKEAIGAEATQADTQAAVDALQDLQSQMEAMKLVDVEQQARRILFGLGFQEAGLGKDFTALSGGWRMRALLASILLQQPDVMILDEPTNFLDLLGVVWLETYLHQMRETAPATTVLVVSHDRAFVNAICEEIVILRDQQLSYFRGNLAAYEKDFEAQKLYWGRMKEAQERQIAHMEATIRENVKIGKKTNDDNKLRMAKSRQKKVNDRMGIQVSAKGTRFKLNRDLPGFHPKARAEIEVPTDEKGASMLLPDATELRFPGPLCSLEGILFRYSPRDPNPVLNGVDLVVHMGDRVGIMGLNGSGKSTLVRVLVGGLQPTQGKISTHARLKVGYYSQHAVEELQEQGHNELELTALGLMMKEVDGALNEGDLRGLLSGFGLAGRIASDVPIARLSGGQLVRLALARTVWTSPQLLILDEITTHLDFHTVTALAAALSAFNGAILLISHDRFLVRSVVEGKRDLEHQLDDGFEGVDEEETEEEDGKRRRSVYVMKGGRLNLQHEGVERFEQSLVKRVQKLNR